MLSREVSIAFDDAMVVVMKLCGYGSSSFLMGSSRVPTSFFSALDLIWEGGFGSFRDYGMKSSTASPSSLVYERIDSSSGFPLAQTRRSTVSAAASPPPLAAAEPPPSMDAPSSSSRGRLLCRRPCSPSFKDDMTVY